jgi:hypothetical protein
MNEDEENAAVASSMQVQKKFRYVPESAINGDVYHKQT